MSRGIRVLTLAIAASLVAPALPAHADPGHEVADNAVIRFTGDGSGHGRGMSQYGAYSAARKGNAFREILRTYYPRTKYRKLAGSIEVLVSADDDNDLVVEDVAGLKVRHVGGESWAADQPGATRWRIEPDGSGGHEVAYFDGSWTTWRTVNGEAEFTAGSKPLTLITPDDRVRYRGALRSSRDDHDRSGDRQRAAAGAVPARRRPLRDAGRLAAAGAAGAGGRRRARTPRWRRTHAMDVAYDLCDTTLCQVYGGASAEAASASKAVKGTAKQVLTFRGKPIFAEYSASNGGYTVAGGKPYLPAKKDPYEGTSSDYYGWKRPGHRRADGGGVQLRRPRLHPHRPSATG